MQPSTQRESKGEKLPILHSFLKKIAVLPIVFICAFTLPSFATGNDCDENTAQEDCTCPGWYWMGSGVVGGCEQCGAGYWCDSGVLTRCSAGSNSMYGAWSADQCYQDVTCGDSPSKLYTVNGTDCIDVGNGTDCFNWAGDNGDFPSQSYHMEDNSCESNTKSCADLGEGYYGGTATWQNGAWNKNGCYKQIPCYTSSNGMSNQSPHFLFPNCNDTIVDSNPGNTYSCPESSSASSDYHMENGTCYGTSMTCSSFGGGGAVGVSGVASYSGTGWNVSDCQKTTAYPYDDPCMGSETSTPSSDTVQYVSNSISWGDAVRTCVGCIAGKIPEDLSFSGCVDVALGYYSEGCRNARAATLPLCVNDDNFYQGVPCPAGMTTDETGATSVDGCHYTTSTKFCGNNGCFTLDGVSGGQSYNEYTWGGGTTAAN